MFKAVVINGRIHIGTKVRSTINSVVSGCLKVEDNLPSSFRLEAPINSIFLRETTFAFSVTRSIKRCKLRLCRLDFILKLVKHCLVFNIQHVSCFTVKKLTVQVPQARRFYCTIQIAATSYLLFFSE